MIGKNKGEMDYKMVVIKYFISNLDRQTEEGQRQTLMEDFQREGKVKVLNSKIDFCQPMRSQFSVVTKNQNNLPGTKPNSNQPQQNFTTKQNFNNKFPHRKLSFAGRKLSNQHQPSTSNLAHDFQPPSTSTPSKKKENNFNKNEGPVVPIAIKLVTFNFDKIKLN